MPTDYEALGKRVSERRRALNWSQEQLAETLNLSISFIGHIERGTRIASLDTLVRLAVTLGVSTNYLLADSMPPDFNRMLLDAAMDDIRTCVKRYAELAVEIEPHSPP